MKSLIIFSCLLALCQGICETYDNCGEFCDDPPFDDRPFPDPPGPSGQNIQLHLHNSNTPPAGRMVHWEDDEEPPEEYNVGMPVSVLIHGWQSNPNSGSVSMNDIKDTILAVNPSDNVIVVDWRDGANAPLYFGSASNTRVVGACIGSMLRAWGVEEDGHCIGHSLGGQTCGYLGYRVAELDGEFGRISGLDPAGPAFNTSDNRVRLDRSDAAWVDIHHTNSDGFSLGTWIPGGHADFYPHAGGCQPPCTPCILNSCDHSACKLYFNASIGETQCNFLSRPCGSSDDAVAGQCDTDVCEVGDQYCQSMGYKSGSGVFTMEGTFYLEVNENYPYCQD